MASPMEKRLEDATRSVIGMRDGDQSAPILRLSSKARNGQSSHRIAVCEEQGEFVSFESASHV